MNASVAITQAYTGLCEGIHRIVEDRGLIFYRFGIFGLENR